MYRSHLEAFKQLGISLEERQRMCETSVAWLTSPGGVAQQLNFLLDIVGCQPPEVWALFLLGERGNGRGGRGCIQLAASCRSCVSFGGDALSCA